MFAGNPWVLLPEGAVWALGSAPWQEAASRESIHGAGTKPQQGTWDWCSPPAVLVLGSGMVKLWG